MKRRITDIRTSLLEAPVSALVIPIVIALLLLALHPPCFALPTFAQANYSIDPATDIVSADVNRDGHLDLIITAYPNQIVRFLGSGTGTFGAPSSFTTGPEPQGMSAADFNGDGSLDLAVADGDTNHISILMGSSAQGTFSLTRTLMAYGGVAGLASGDLNGDGRLDLVAASANAHKLSVFFGLGNGSFAARIDYGNCLECETGPSAIALADFNHDNRLDVATASYYSRKISVRLNSGNGTLLSPRVIDIGVNSRGVIATDLDGDSHVDLAFQSSFWSWPVPGFLVLLRNLGNGTFAAPVTWYENEYPGYGFHNLGVSNLSSDNIPDIVTTASAVCYNPTMTDGVMMPYSYTPRGSITTADFNEDGHPDIAGINTYLGTSLLVQINAKPNAPQSVYASADQPEAVYIEWTPVEGADGYRISRDGTALALISDELEDYEYMDDTPGPGTHQYCVTAFNSLGESQSSCALGSLWLPILSLGPVRLRKYESKEFDLNDYWKDDASVASWYVTDSQHVHGQVFGGHYLELSAAYGFSGTELLTLSAYTGRGTASQVVQVNCVSQPISVGRILWKERGGLFGQSLAVFLDRSTYQLPNATEVWDAVQSGIEQWSNPKYIDASGVNRSYVSVTFVPTKAQADVAVKFRGTEVCLPIPFEVPDAARCSGVLFGQHDHCPFDISTIHLNSHYRWVRGVIEGAGEYSPSYYEGYNLYYHCVERDVADAYYSAMHEFGHALGFGHFEDPTGIATSLYTANHPTMFELPECGFIDVCGDGRGLELNPTLSATERYALAQRPRRRLTATAHSPVDLELVTPSGNVISKGSNPFPEDSGYGEGSPGDTQEPASIDQVWLCDPDEGMYRLYVVPDSTARLDDSVSVEVTLDGRVLFALPKSPIAEIVPGGYQLVVDGVVSAAPVSAAASRSEEGVLVQWTVISDGDAISRFDVYRQDNSSERRVVARGVAGVGGRYRWMDRDAPALASYWIYEVRRNGQVRWCGPLSITVGGQEVGRPALVSIAPNPFSVSTEIVVDGVAGSDAEVAIFDITGRPVRVFHLGGEDEGPMRLVWDGRNDKGTSAVSGVYYVRLSSGGMTVVHRILRVR